MIKVNLKCKITRPSREINQVIEYKRFIYDADAELAIPKIKERIAEHLVEAVRILCNYKLLTHQISFLLDKSLSLKDTVDFYIRFSDEDTVLIEITYSESGYTQ